MRNQEKYLYENDDVMIWKRFQYYWPFVWRINQPEMLNFGVFCQPEQAAEQTVVLPVI